MRHAVVPIAVVLIVLLVAPAIAGRKPVPPIELEECCYHVDFLDPGMPDEMWEIQHEGEWDLKKRPVNPQGCWDWWSYCHHEPGWIEGGLGAPYPQLHLAGTAEPGISAVLGMIPAPGVPPIRIAELIAIP